MESFGKTIPVTGPDALEPKEQVWFSEVRIFKSGKSGHATYDVHYQHPTDGDDIDAAVRVALKTVVEQLTAKASHKGSFVRRRIGVCFSSSDTPLEQRPQWSPLSGIRDMIP